MKKIILILLSASYLFAMINVQSASKEELMSIDGIGEKKAESIIEYRKTHPVKNPEDLLLVKGIGPNIVQNIKDDIKIKTKK